MKVKIVNQEFIGNSINGNPVYCLWFKSDDIEDVMNGYTKKDAGWTLEHSIFIGEAEIEGHYSKTGRFIITDYEKTK